jgi:hypothetical protein
MDERSPNTGGPRLPLWSVSSSTAFALRLCCGGAMPFSPKTIVLAVVASVLDGKTSTYAWFEVAHQAGIDRHVRRHDDRLLTALIV